MDSGCKRAILVWHRRSGKDKTALNFTIKKMFDRVGVYYYFMPTYSQGKKIIWDGIDKDGFKFLDHFPKSIIVGEPNQTEMKIKTINGSLFQIVGTDNVNSIVGTNPVGCVFSEYALQNPHAWDFVRPILRENNGWAVFCFCVVPNTIIWTKNGLCRIGEELKDAPFGFSEHIQSLYGTEGMDQSIMAYRGRKQKTIKITTAKGYEMQCTFIHPLWDGTAWRESKDWKIGDRIPLQVNQQCFGSDSPNQWVWKRQTHGTCKDFPFRMDKDLCYTLGLILAEGNWGERSCTVTNIDKEIIDFLHRYNFITYKDKVHHILSNKEFCSFLDWIGIPHGAKNKVIPEKILRLKKEFLVEFLKGYFDGDGCATKKGSVHCDTVSEGLSEQIHALLLNFGIVSRRKAYITKPSQKVKAISHGWRIAIEGHWAEIFFENIGFRLGRKQSRRIFLSERQISQRQDEFFIPDIPSSYWKGLNAGDIKRQAERGILSFCTIERLHKKRPLDIFDKILKDGFHFDVIKKIDYNESEVMDFVIPKTHSFTTNGFLSHNTPRGMNHGYDILETARLNSDWFSQVLTVEDTKVISQEEIEKERKEGMPEELIQQEFYCSFESSLVGAYYSQQLKQARDENRITNVPYDLALPVYTFWDLGIGDSTAIGFYQFIGKEKHMIDYYENSGEGLPHYAKVLQEKGYVYAQHWAPHDIKVRELGTGLSRLETAKNLGINYRIVRNVSLEDGINAGRLVFNSLWIDKEKCSFFLKALVSYVKKWDDNRKCFQNEPYHSWASHAADMHRYFAIESNFASRHVWKSPTDQEFERRMMKKSDKKKVTSYNLMGV